MTDPRNAEATAMRLAELSHEVEELEDSRAALLRRVDQIRASLMAAGNRAMTMRASIDLLCEHLTNMVTTMAELHALEQEIQEVGRGLEENVKDTSMLSFKASRGTLADIDTIADCGIRIADCITITRQLAHHKSE